MKLWKMDNIVYYAEAQRLEASYSDNPYVVWYLYPIAIRDYVDPDWSDAQGWVQEKHKGKLQLDDKFETLTQSVVYESFNQVAQDFGYETIDFDSPIWFVDYDNWDERKDSPTRVKMSANDALKNAINGFD